jgi:hypothetical protein
MKLSLRTMNFEPTTIEHLIALTISSNKIISDVAITFLFTYKKFENFQLIDFFS